MRSKAILLLAVFVAATSHAVDGAKIAERCDGCHGPNGQSEDPNVPAIGGFSAYATLDLLESYRNGDRTARPYEDPERNETNMKEISESLSAAQAQAVADHYEQQSWDPPEQSFDATLAKRGAAVHEIKCARCHADYGSDPYDELALLLGQWRDYLAREFANFDDGSRKLPDKMGDKYKSLSDSDKQALLELYVSGGRF
jgi:sulfide dehydrogenase cytochrome subunit